MVHSSRVRRSPFRIRNAFYSLGAAVALGLLVYTDVLLLQSENAPVHAPTPARSGGNWVADFPASIDQVTEALARLPLPLPTPREEAQGGGRLRWTRRRYEASLPAPQPPNTVDDLFAPVREA